MFKLKRNILFLVVALFVAKFAYAAVVSIADTEYSSTFGTRFLSAEGGGSTPPVSTFSITPCGEWSYIGTSSDGCKSVLGIGNPIFEPCTNSDNKSGYNCECPAEYSKDCSGENEIGEGSPCKKNNKYKSCKIVSEQICDAVRGLYAGGTLVASSSDCSNKQGGAYAGYAECKDTDGTKKYFCIYEKCELLATTNRYQAHYYEGNVLENWEEQGGIKKGKCVNSSGAVVDVYQCGADYTASNLNHCEDGESAPVCRLEKSDKYYKECYENELCKKTDMFVTNTAGYNAGCPNPFLPSDGNCPTTGYARGVNKGFCSLKEDGSNIRVCKCLDEYKYTRATCAIEPKPTYLPGATMVPVAELKTQSLRTKNNEGMATTAYWDLCLWDSQTSYDSIQLNFKNCVNSRYLAKTFDVSKVKYKRCLPVCPAGEGGKTSEECASAGMQYFECAQLGNITDDGEHDYNIYDDVLASDAYQTLKTNTYTPTGFCSCPSNWYTAATCPSGYLGGRKCTVSDVDRYEFCLPKCDSSGRLAEHGSDNCGIGGYTPIEKFTCYLASGTQDWRCNLDGTGKKCCPNGNPNSDRCTTSYVVSAYTLDSNSASATACFPTTNGTLASGVCSQGNGQNAKWQCRCPEGYKTEAECQAENILNQVSGRVCALDGENKYEFCGKLCPSANENKIVDAPEECGTTMAKDASERMEIPREKCLDKENNRWRYVCKCPQKDGANNRFITFIDRALTSSVGKGLDYWSNVSKQEKLDACQNNSTCRTYLKEHVPSIYSAGRCFAEARFNGVENNYFIKSIWVGYDCDGYQETHNNQATIRNSRTACGLGAGEEIQSAACFDNSFGDIGSINERRVCFCPEGYKTLEQYCRDNPHIADCLNTTLGVGTPCYYDLDSSFNKLTKYGQFSTGAICPDTQERPVYTSEGGCDMVVDDSIVSGTSQACYDRETHEPQYTCLCPEGFGTTCEKEGEIRGGAVCTNEGYAQDKRKYQKCLPKCTDTPTTPSVKTSGSCPTIDGIPADESEQCFSKYGDEEPYYVCRCPKGYNYQTLDEFCETKNRTEGLDVETCRKQYVGVGTPCTFDGLGVNKYKSFDILCPTDGRPVYYSIDDCTTSDIPGSVEYTCHERGQTDTRYVCKCPDSWVDINGVNRSGTRVCNANEEPSGTVCAFEGDARTKIKYEKCYRKCDSVMTNGHGIKYMEEEFATEYECQNLLGEGASFGATGTGDQCSRNNTLAWPCYCGSDYSRECLNSDNEQPEEGATACTIDGKTYYNQCKTNACAVESPTVAVVPLPMGISPETYCASRFGNGARGKKCGTQMAECSCDASVYNSLCEYPYKAPSIYPYGDFCTYGEGTTLMSSGGAQKHYKVSSCQVAGLAKCGEYVLDGAGNQDRGYLMFVTQTESECSSSYGPGAFSQMCEYSDTGRRAYNCYFKLSDYPVGEDECPVRKVPGTDYVKYKGKTYYKNCKCHQTYKHHRYNCAGMLNGGVCRQEVTNEMKRADPTLVSAGIISGTELDFYPYCQCPADYNQVCDGERNIGVGEPCNGKYKSCECKKDELPLNWADNYYGCPGGEKPTGVTKPNGCGGKYYQCSVNSCTWQHTEKCLPPLIGIDECQDDQGKIGGYKSCRCPDGYKVCPENTVGEGEPCILKGEYHYASCVTQRSCVRGENKTCQGEYLIGVNPCIRNNVTYFEYCTCAAGFTKLCENGEVGVGPSCKLDGKEYYQSCSAPTTTCTPEHKESCDTSQEKYDPCVTSDNQLLYKCKCPSNWSTCSGVGKADNATTCTDTDGKEFYSQCKVDGECSDHQNRTYKECTASQRGTGGSCISFGDDGEVVVKYANCEETTACRTNGYQYTCLGFNQDSLGTDFCIDENGNKLYKECKCPSNWITCPSRNNKKGRSCIGMSSSGQTLEAVYESCECDEAIYKYTCNKEGSNQGVISASTKSCTSATFEDGQRIEGETKYENCACDSRYKYTCTGNGQLIENENDYCQKVAGGEKYYQACYCDEAKFNQTCAVNASNPGLGAPTSESKICTPVPNQGRGSLYSECECGADYTLNCTEKGQQGGTGFCAIGSDTKYNECTCNDKYPFDCKMSGANKGITKPLDTSDFCKAEKKKDGIVTTTIKYPSCSCKAAYKYTCKEEKVIVNGKEETTTPSYYKKDENDYCEIQESESYTDEKGNSYQTFNSVRKYKSCVCNNSFKDCLDTGKASGTESCMEISASGNVIEKYAQCCSPVRVKGEYYEDEVNGWIRYETKMNPGSYSSSSSLTRQQLESYAKNECKQRNRKYKLKHDGCLHAWFTCCNPEHDTYCISSN